MAKAANAPEFNPSAAKKVHKQVLQLHDDILSARGTYMNRARRIKENIASAIEAGAGNGLNPKIIKLQIQVHQKIESLKETLAKLDAEERKEAAAYAKAIGMPVQLQMFKELPAAKAAEPKPEKATAAKKAVKQKPARKPKKAKASEAPEIGVEGEGGGSNVTHLSERAAANSSTH